MDESVINSLIKKAVEITDKPYTKEEIIAILQKEDEFEKPVAILSLDTISDKKEAEALISHLTGCDGRIREVSAIKISEFLCDTKTAEYFSDEKSVRTILNGIMDINPNVGRAITDGIKNCQSLQTLLLPLLLERLSELTEKLKEMSKTPYFENKLNDKRNHAKNKIVFNLYWGLEALCNTNFNNSDNTIKEKILNILSFSSGYTDYTIREKTAKILSKMENAPDDLLQKLKNDENFYVKNQLL